MNGEYFQHPGDVHAPEEFGFDLRNENDVKRWAEITGETPVTPPEPAKLPDGFANIVDRSLAARHLVNFSIALSQIRK